MSGNGDAMRAGTVLEAFRGLPLVDLAGLTGGETVLVLAPHPDDESLGCGGLIALSAGSDAPAAVMVMTDGGESHPGSRDWPRERLVALRQAEARDAVAALGLEAGRLGFAGLRDAAVPLQGAIFEGAVRAVGERAAAVGATILAAPWREDPHGDHLAVQMIARDAARRGGLRLLSYPVWGWTLPEAAPTRERAPIRGMRLDVAAVLPAKRRAIAAHRSQHGLVVRDDPDAFVLPAVLLEPCDQPFEVFIETDPGAG